MSKTKEDRPSFAYFSIAIDSDVMSEAYNISTNENHVGYACISLMRPPKGSESGHFTAGISFCSPLDVMDSLGRINKKKARAIAEGRRQCMRPGRRIDLDMPKAKTYNLIDVHRAVLERAISDDLVILKHGHKVNYAPRWALEAVKHGADFTHIEHGKFNF